MKNIISLSDILSDTSEPPEAIVEGGILLKDTMLVIIGSAKTGKTFLGMNLALSIASGTEFLGFNIRQDKKVLYLCAEGGYYPNRDRLKIMSESLDEASTGNALFHFNSNLSLDDFIDALSREKLLTSPNISHKQSIRKKEGNGFNDIAGMNELKSILTKEVIDVIKNKEKYEEYGVTIPNGMLLYGPPGCGKTFISSYA